MSEYTPTVQRLKEAWGTNAAPFTSPPKGAAQFDRAITKVRAEARAEALEDAASELCGIDMAGADEPVTAFEAAEWLRTRAAKYRAGQ